MFIKVTTSSGRRYAQLVESYRNEQGQPRQRMIATLGRLEPGGDVDRLIAGLNRAQGRDAGASTSVRDLQFLESRSAGDVWALWQLWRALGLEGLALAWGRSRSELDVLACLRAMVFNRLCDPASKLGVLRWLQTVALPLGFGFDSALPGHQHLLRAMDVIDEHADAIGERLSVLMRPLIDQDLSVVFYDLTTIRVHGEAEVDQDVRAFGRSKEGGIARQFMLSLVQTADGLPIAHCVHPGNTAEPHTLGPMITGLLERWPLRRVMLVADRGLLSLENLEELARLQQQLAADGHAVRLEYVIAVPGTRYTELTQELTDLDEAHGLDVPWQADTIWKRRADQKDPQSPEKTWRLVVAHDPLAAQRRRQQRDAAIDELVAMGEQWGGKLDAQDAGKRRRGRPLSDSGAKARMYHAVKDAGLAHLIKVDLAGELFEFQIDELQRERLRRLDGKLLLVTNSDAPAGEIVERYKSLADIERGFRVLKSEIEIGPVFHRLPRRIRAHALVCYLALVLHRVLRMRLRAAQREESPARLLEQLARIHQQTARTADGQLIGGLTELGPAQKALFAAVDLPVPAPSEIVRNDGARL